MMILMITATMMRTTVMIIHTARLPEKRSCRRCLQSGCCHGFHRRFIGAVATSCNTVCGASDKKSKSQGGVSQQYRRS